MVIGHWTLVMLLASLVSTVPRSEAPLRADRPPNFIVILADDQGWTGTSVQLHPEIEGSRSDYYRTPNIERLATQGMRFSSAYASAPNCSPTRCSLLTGLCPARTGMTDLFYRRGAAPHGPLTTAKNIRTMDSERVTLPEALKLIDASYRTAHFGKWHLGSGGPEMHGFDVSDGISTNLTGNARIPNDPKRIFSTTARAITFLREQAEQETPFFLQVSHYAVHMDTETLEETRDRCSRRTPGRRHSVASYAAMTEDLDTGVGLLLDELEALGLVGNTHVVFFSDNGPVTAPEITNNEPLRGGKSSLWEGGIRVPLIVRGPGVRAGSYSSSRVVAHDLYPTICDLAGGLDQLPTDLDGGSMKPLLLGEGRGAVARRDDYIVFHFPHYHVPRGSVPQSAIIRGPYKLIKSWEDGAHRLFSIDTDVTESDDLSERLPELAADLDGLLTSYLTEVGALMATPNPEWDAAKQAEFDAVFGKRGKAGESPDDGVMTPDSPPRRADEGHRD